MIIPTPEQQTLMESAKLWAKRSTCKRLQVGAVISKNGRILSTGFNGTVTGADNCCEEICEKCKGEGIIMPFSGHTDPEKCKRCNATGTVSKSETIHAEANSILFASRNGIATEECSIFITHAPCIECAKMIKQCGITSVYFLENYKNKDGIIFLVNNKVFVQQLNF